ncbi:MAG: hypothetical protein NZ899_15070 [Thermoguttaceae bacterium]|nr:hypothetical protein [Thermoguttaceae bacterium]MDW8080246.1 hypothetical protein [Thermoguttaceae bacterium]
MIILFLGLIAFVAHEIAETHRLRAEERQLMQETQQAVKRLLDRLP